MDVIRRVSPWAAGLVLVACGVWPATGQPPAEPRPAVRDRGFQDRHGDEILVCGRPYRIGTRVVLWTDEGGFDAYRTARRFGPYDRSDWKRTVEEMRAGALNFASEHQETSPPATTCASARPSRPHSRRSKIGRAHV
mgnify:CR=1 FL=1